MAQVIIPITQGQNQTITTTLPINGGNTTLTFTFQYNNNSNYWYMTIVDSNSATLLDAIPLTVGNPPYNILAPYQYLNIGSAYVIPSSSGLPDIPNFNTLGFSTTNSTAPTFYLVWTDNKNYLS